MGLKQSQLSTDSGLNEIFKYLKTELKAGELTEFSCTGARKKKGEEFSVNVNITYTKTIGNLTTTSHSYGTIRGTVE